MSGSAFNNMQLLNYCNCPFFLRSGHWHWLVGGDKDHSVAIVTDRCMAVQPQFIYWRRPENETLFIQTPRILKCHVLKSHALLTRRLSSVGGWSGDSPPCTGWSGDSSVWVKWRHWEQSCGTWPNQPACAKWGWEWECSELGMEKDYRRPQCHCGQLHPAQCTLLITFSTNNRSHVQHHVVTQWFALPILKVSMTALLVPLQLVATMLTVWIIL